MTRHLLTAALAAVVLSVLPVHVVVDSPENMPRGLPGHTTVSGGRCVITVTPEGARRREVMAHERCHCELDADVLGPFGFEGISEREVQRREARVIQCARRRR